MTILALLDQKVNYEIGRTKIREEHVFMFHLCLLFAKRLNGLWGATQV